MRGDIVRVDVGIRSGLGEVEPQQWLLVARNGWVVWLEAMMPVPRGAATLGSRHHGDLLGYQATESAQPRGVINKCCQRKLAASSPRRGRDDLVWWVATGLIV